MTGREQNELFARYLSRMAAIRSTKNKDYANDVDSLANFRMVETMGLPAWVGILTRLGDKYARAAEQARKVINGEELTFAVSSEGFDDLCIDGANYFVLMGVAFEEWKRAQELAKVPTATYSIPSGPFTEVFPVAANATAPNPIPAAGLTFGETNIPVLPRWECPSCANVIAEGAPGTRYDCGRR